MPLTVVGLGWLLFVCKFVVVDVVNKKKKLFNLI